MDFHRLHQELESPAFWVNFYNLRLIFISKGSNFKSCKTLEHREHYTIEQLKSNKLPEEVDLLNKEVILEAVY